MLDDLIKELKFNPPSRKKAPTSGRNWDSPSNSNSKGNSRSPVTAASRSSGTWNKGDSKPGEAPIVPNADQFESFEDYLNALVSYEKGGHSGERKWFKSEKEVVVPASSTKQTDQGTKESFDSFFEALIPTSESPTRKTQPCVVVSSTPNNEVVIMNKDLL